MTELLAPELTWPTVADNQAAGPTEEAHILHALVIERGIPEIVLTDRILLAGTDIPGNVQFDRGNGPDMAPHWYSWADMYADILGPPLDGSLLDLDVARTPTGTRRCAGRYRAAKRRDEEPRRCKRGAVDGSAFCDQHESPPDF